MSRIAAGCFAMLLALCSCLPMHGGEASKRAKLEEMFTLIHMERTLNQIADQQSAQVKKLLPTLIPDEGLSESDRKSIEGFADRQNAMVRDAISWQKLKAQYLDLYAATYDEATVDGMVAFYKSDAGRTMVAKQPELIAKSQGIAQARLAELQPKMEADFEHFLQAMQQKQAPEAQQPGAAAQPPSGTR